MRAASASKDAANSFDTPASDHRPFSARRRGRYRLLRWHPSGNRRGSAIAFAIARAIRATDEDGGDQFSRRLSRGGMTKSFREGERVRWSASAGSDNPYDRTIGGRGLRAGSLGPLPGAQTAKQQAKPFGADPE